MKASCAAICWILRAALVAAAISPAVRAADDVVAEDEPAPPARQEQQPPFGGQVQGGRIIVMPGLRLQVGGPGQLQVQGNVGVPNAAAAGNGPQEPSLGVILGPVSPAVRAQLDVPEGVGLSIDGVVEGGPAAKAGVRQFDVIREFNGQVVRSVAHLTALVKVAGAGTKVPLKLVRGGRETVVEAMLEARGAVPGADDGGVVQAWPGVIELQQMIPPGAVGNGGAQVLTIGPAALGATTVSDGRGTVELRWANGRKTVTVKDPRGREVYSGPLDTAEDLEQVPEESRAWVREIDAGQQVSPPVRPGTAVPAAESARRAGAAGGPRD
jgi:hypothetical protein